MKQKALSFAYAYRYHCRTILHDQVAQPTDVNCQDKLRNASRTAISRAAKLTTSPKTLYSCLTLLPTVPQNTFPVLECDVKAHALPKQHVHTRSTHTRMHATQAYSPNMPTAAYVTPMRFFMEREVSSAWISIAALTALSSSSSWENGGIPKPAIWRAYFSSNRGELTMIVPLSSTRRFRTTPSYRKTTDYKVSVSHKDETSS